MESNRNKDDSGEESDVPAGGKMPRGKKHAEHGHSNSDEVEEENGGGRTCESPAASATKQKGVKKSDDHGEDEDTRRTQPHCTN